jgi:hypothetical protein
MPVILNLTIRLALCVVITYFAWKRIGTIGIVTCLPLFGMAFARPILNGLGELRRLMRQSVYSGVQGRHYSFNEKSIEVVEDEDDYRWLRAADVRKVLEHFPRDDALLSLFGKRAQTKGAMRDLWVRADELQSYLAKSTTINSIRFKVWLERAVIFPTERHRKLKSPATQPAARNDPAP